MKYFTDAWHSGEMDERTIKETEDRYYKRLEELCQAMPPDLKRLAVEVNLHDALIESVEINEVDHELKLCLVIGDLNIGYQSLKIVYTNLYINKNDVKILEQLSRDRETSILCQEIDCEKNGFYVQRLLFWPAGEITISFRNLKLTLTQRENRAVDLEGYFISKE